MTRSVEDARAAAAECDPIALNRLLAAHESLNEARETVSTASRRRAEAVVDLVDAGVSYSDVGRLLDVGAERIRQLAAQHLGVSVSELNPRTTTTPNRH